MLDRVGYGHDDRRRTKLQKVMQQHRVLKYIENRAEQKGAPVDGLAYKFAMKANRRQRKLSLLAKKYVELFPRFEIVTENLCTQKDITTLIGFFA